MAKKDAEQSKSVVLKELAIETFQVRVEGLSPLIVHAWDAKVVQQIADKQQRKAGGEKEARNPQAEYESCFYPKQNGKHTVKSAMFKHAMVSAATSLKDKSFPKTLIRQVVFVMGDYVEINGSAPKMRDDMVRIGNGCQSRYRPEFEKWSCELTIQYNRSAVSADQIVALLDLAGFAVGICEWRPEKNGNNGRFRVARSG